MDSPGERTWALGPFTRHGGAVLRPSADLRFRCPVTGVEVSWAAKDLFNPGAVVRDGKVHLLVRGEDAVGPFSGTSRIGLAVSEDGVAFSVEPEPVLYPEQDRWQSWEWPGGCEDPRVVEAPDGGYVCTYTGFDGRTPVDFDATGDAYLTHDPDTPDRPWTVHRVEGQRALRPLLFARRGRFDSLVVEPGPPAVRTAEGIVLVYNGANHPGAGDPSLPALSYQPGQALFDPADPTACVARPPDPFLRAEGPDEADGQVPNVCFAQGLVLLEDTWHLYYGMADARIGCATAPVANVP